jgi:hypothetical protein
VEKTAKEENCMKGEKIALFACFFGEYLVSLHHETTESERSLFVDKSDKNV